MWNLKHVAIHGQVKSHQVQKLYLQTDVMPAKAPLASLFGVSSSFEPCLVNHWEKYRENHDVSEKTSRKKGEMRKEKREYPQ